MPQIASPRGLAATDAPFIEEARTQGQLFIQQPYELYTEENHEAWRNLYGRMQPQWERYAHPHFQHGLASLALDPDHIPRLADVNRHLLPLTGFQTKAVAGYVPAFLFFDCLRNRQFPVTITIRRPDSLDYLPEPDVFHDVAGHVPMLTDPHFAEILVRFGECAHTAAALVSQIGDETRRIRTLTNILKAMARFFWFTVEFGLMQSFGGVKAYGSGLLSSYGEIQHAVESPEVQRSPIQLEWAIHQSFEIGRYQPLLFVADSLEHVFSLLGRLEYWMAAGRLDNVAPGEPKVNEADLKSFLLHSA